MTLRVSWVDLLYLYVATCLVVVVFRRLFKFDPVNFATRDEHIFGMALENLRLKSISRNFFRKSETAASVEGYS